MDNTGHYFCLQSSALTHSLSLFIHTDLSEGSKPVRFPPPFSALEMTNQVFSSPPMPLCSWHCGDFLTVLLIVFWTEWANTWFVKKRIDHSCQNAHTFSSKYIPWILASWEQDTCKFRVTPHFQDLGVSIGQGLLEVLQTAGSDLLILHENSLTPAPSCSLSNFPRPEFRC